ncbi:MAG: acyltransferase family protein [Pseudomonadota bacterium]
MQIKDKAGPRPDFRNDINGLRAWAVLSVILYHFGIPGFKGGFVGVDIFFVISGYLMTGIVVKGLERGTFSLTGFYMARAKRIVPALLGLCAVLLALGWFVLLPPEYKTLSSHAIYSMSFLSNIEYWQEAGYFDSASHEKWLLHTWSLSVEWQFYLLLPVVLWAAWRLKPGRGAQRWTIALGIALSLGASVFTSGANPTAAFYLLHTRAWEMLGGGLVFLLPAFTWMSSTRRRWMETAGLLLILLSIATFDKNVPWPGWRAILPVSAAMLVLFASRVSPWTGNRVAQWIGDRSYSLYLWHWPVYVSLVYIELRYDAAALAGGLLATFILGHYSHAWVEQPARNLLGRIRFRSATVVLIAAVTAVTLPGMAVWRMQGIGGRFPAIVERAAAETGNVNPRRAVCHPRVGSTSPSCIYGGGSDWKAIAVGDSHAEAVVTGFAKAGPSDNAGVVQWSYSSCPFVSGLKKVPSAVLNQPPEYKCTEFIEWADRRLDALPAAIPVVIIGRYAAAAFGPNEDRLDVDTPMVYFSKIYPVTTPAFIDEFSHKVTDSACALAKHRTVYMMRPIPEMGVDVPKTLSRRMSFGMKGEVSISMDAYHKRNDWIWAAQDAAHKSCGVKILDPLPYLCHDGRCYGSRDGRPLYHDDNHLSESGNKLLVPMFAEVFRQH